MNMYEVIMDLEESDVYNISSIVIDRVSNVENLLIHGFTNIYSDWDELVFDLARTCIKLEFKHIVIAEHPVPEMPDDWYQMLNGQLADIDYDRIDDCIGILTPDKFINACIYENTRKFYCRDCGDKPKHIQLIEDAEFVFGMADEKIVESYIRLLKQFKKKFIIGVDSVIADKLIKKYDLKLIDMYTTANNVEIEFIGTDAHEEE